MSWSSPRRNLAASQRFFVLEGRILDARRSPHGGFYCARAKPSVQDAGGGLSGGGRRVLSRSGVARVPPRGHAQAQRSFGPHGLHDHLLAAAWARSAARPGDRHGDPRETVRRDRRAGLSDGPPPRDPGLGRVIAVARGVRRVHAGGAVVVAAVLELLQLLPRIGGGDRKSVV